MPRLLYFRPSKGESSNGSSRFVFLNLHAGNPASKSVSETESPHSGERAQSRRQELIPQHQPDRVLRLGRPGRRRSVFHQLWPGKRLPDPEGSSPSGALRGPGHHPHHFRDQRQLFADHRAVPHRRRGIPGGQQAAQPLFGHGLRLRAPHRLRPDPDHLHRRGRGRHLQLPPAGVAPLQGPRHNRSGSSSSP